MIIDAHVHVCDRLIPFNGTNLDPRPEHLLECMEENGVDKAVLLTFEGSTNEYLADIVRKYLHQFVGFARLLNDGNPTTAPGPILKELTKAVTQLGLKGVKIDPRPMGINVNDPKITLIVEKARDLGVPVLIHSHPGFYRSKPEYFLELAYSVYDAKIIMGHMGGIRFLESIMLPKNVFLEVSATLPDVVAIFGSRLVTRALRKAGVERVLFGSDFPICDQTETLKVLRSLNLTQDEREKILHENAEKLLRWGL